ncbi:hypothetical protein ACU686_29465 [Yinghuangia aomiensis]
MCHAACPVARPATAMEHARRSSPLSLRSRWRLRRPGGQCRTEACASGARTRSQAACRRRPQISRKAVHRGGDRRACAAYPSIFGSQAHDDMSGGYDFHEIFAGVAADRCVSGRPRRCATMETVIRRLPTAWSPPTPLFKAPAADRLRASSTPATTAAPRPPTNTASIVGFDGACRRTLADMDAAGLRLAGVGRQRSADEAAKPPGDVPGQVARRLSRTWRGRTAPMPVLPLPDGKPWTVNVVDVPRQPSRRRGRPRDGRRGGRAAEPAPGLRMAAAAG